MDRHSSDGRAGPGVAGGIAHLAAMVAQFKYKTGWRFWLETGATGTLGGCPALPDEVAGVLAPAMIAVTWGEPVRLVICLTTEDSTRPGEQVSVPHRFDVPADDSGVPWHWWLMNCIHSVEVHEMCEAFDIGGVRPFYPEHGPGARLYAIIDRNLLG